MSSEPNLSSLQQAVIQFRDARDWQQFHQPRQLVTALQIECAELQEELLWLDDAQVTAKLKTTAGRTAIEDEMADILAYLLCLAEASEISLADALQRKLIKNEQKYPVEQARGKATKYTAYQRKEDLTSQAD